MSRDLAAALGAPWVPEYGREHTGLKPAAARAFDPDASIDSLVWTVGDFQDVARRQRELADAAVDGPDRAGRPPPCPVPADRPRRRAVRAGRVAGRRAPARERLRQAPAACEEAVAAHFRFADPLEPPTVT